MPHPFQSKQSVTRLAKAFIASFMPGVIKPLHALWNEVLAFVFFILAIFLSLGPVRRSYRELDGDPANFIKFVLAVVLAILMLGFGLYSFLRARKISRS
ncbi:MAG: hypothetical protein ABSC08_02860 [Bryobacteraceae bacterium]|jgi:hypothetical protein